MDFFGTDVTELVKAGEDSSAFFEAALLPRDPDKRTLAHRLRECE
jgi:hypothetical protein